MKHAVSIVLSLLLFSACNNEKQRQELRKKELALQQKEQELLLREKQLELREQQLAEPDTSANEGAKGVYNPKLEGTWQVNMICTNTDCASSAIGDTKKEQWDLAYENQTLVARAKANDQLVRTYSGKAKGNQIELSASQNTSENQQAAKINIQLKVVNDNRLEGQREVRREDGCKIIYSIHLTRQ